MNNINGIPVGWKFSKYATLKKGEWYMTCFGKVAKADNTIPDIYYTIVIPDNVYNRPLEEVLTPEGFERGEFREVKEGDWFISCVDYLAINIALFYPGEDCRRITLKKKPTTKRIAIVEFPLLENINIHHCNFRGEYTDDNNKTRFLYPNNQYVEERNS